MVTTVHLPNSSLKSAKKYKIQNVEELNFPTNPEIPQRSWLTVPEHTKYAEKEEYAISTHMDSKVE